ADRHAIAVRGGKIHHENADKETPHRAAHRLHLADMRWELIARRECHRRFVFEAAEAPPDELEPKAFRPQNVSHTWLPPEYRGVDVYHLDVQGVRVTFEDFYDEVKTLVEGDLAPAVVDRLITDVLGNLRRSTKRKWTCREEESFKNG